MNTPTPQQIAKLPKWAQDHIKDLSRQREVTIRTLNESLDKQTPSPFYYEDNLCTGEQSGPVRKRIYVQTHWLYVEWEGVQLQILLREGQRQIDLKWYDQIGNCRDVAFIPSSYQSARLVARGNMQ